MQLVILVCIECKPAPDTKAVGGACMKNASTDPAGMQCKDTENAKHNSAYSRGTEERIESKTVGNRCMEV